MIKKSILKLSEIDDGNWGAEYYHPDKLESIKKLSKFNNIISTFFSSIKKTYKINKKEAQVVNLENVNEGFIKGFSSEKSKSSKKLIKKEDIIISKLRPYLKEIAFISEKFGGNYISTEFIILRENNKDKDLRFILLPFLFTKEIQSILFWSQQGTNHPRFNENVLLRLGFPNVSQSIKNKIKDKLYEAYINYDRAKELYKEAEERLNKELKISPIKLNKQKVFIKSFSEIWKNQRIDAEYYKPEYEGDISYIKNLGYNLIEDENIKDKNFKPKDKEQYKYIELANINQSLGLVEDFIFDYGLDLSTRARRIVRSGDVIISSIEGSLNSSALVLKEQDNALCSTGFYVLNMKEAYKPEFLVILMKNTIIQSLLKRGCSGTILSAISKDELKKIPLPKIDEGIQDEIVTLIKQAYNLHNKSKTLLNETIQEIEKEIESIKKEQSK